MTFPTISIGPLVFDLFVHRQPSDLFILHADAWDRAVRLSLTMFGVEFVAAWRTDRVPTNEQRWSIGCEVYAPTYRSRGYAYPWFVVLAHLKLGNWQIG
jgi:hypothetical protein